MKLEQAQEGDDDEIGGKNGGTSFFLSSVDLFDYLIMVGCDGGV
jgi:hypothetical protein